MRSLVRNRAVCFYKWKIKRQYAKLLHRLVKKVGGDYHKTITWTARHDWSDMDRNGHLFFRNE